MGLRIGIDVGGTNTDAVLLEGERVASWVKAPTTPDVQSGIGQALRSLVAESGADPSALEAVMLGTTQLVNALVQVKGLEPVGMIRVGLPSGAAIPPLYDWPEELRRTVGDTVVEIHGGYEYDGSSLADLRTSELDAVVARIRQAGLRNLAIASVFSPIAADAEEYVAGYLRDRLGGVAISLSSQIGRIGLLERENATVINAMLGGLAEVAFGEFRRTLASVGITAPLYVTQNDGTVMDLDYAMRYPVHTFGSGPTNSMRGAAILSGLRNCLVVDVGGTTSDIGVLQAGFPRPAAIELRVQGIRTNFRMPDVLSVGIGGGSIVRTDGSLTIGPDSVGHELTRRALVYGGDSLTVTDIAVAAGRIELGDPGRVAHLDQALVRDAMGLITRRISQEADRMRTDSAPLPLVLVGGGAALIPDELPGFDTVIRPAHAAVANAFGAASAQVGGEIDRVYSLAGTSREEVLERARAEAVEQAVAAGAQQESVEVVDVDEVPIAYLPGSSIRLRVKAVGDLAALGAANREVRA